MESYPLAIEEFKEYITSQEWDTVKKGKHNYYNISAAFDIETSSFYNMNDDKCACMYIWQLGFNGRCTCGRTWNEFTELISWLENTLLTANCHLIVYVHNLNYEFQFMRKRFKWDKVFSMENRKVIYCITEGGIEFRCNYMLSGYALAKLPDELQKYKVQKMVGDLDYSKIRHKDTPLTDKELTYCINDILVVMAYIQEKIEREGNITKLPLTKTGYVRNYCRNNCYFVSAGHRTKEDKKKYSQYRQIMSALTLDPVEYGLLKRAFQGGFTHAGAWYSGKILHNVNSIDFTSSYPAVMVAEQYPMSRGKRVTVTNKAEFDRYMKFYCCLFNVTFEGLEAVFPWEHYISASRCWAKDNPVIDNGRIVSADRVVMTITGEDYKIISQTYTWSAVYIGTMYVYHKEYLPTDFIKSILKLYEDKTTLKGVAGKEVEYLSGKEMLNSCYGMTVTDIVRDSYPYDTDWREPETPDINDAIEKYNRSKNRFLFYPWGVWVTAYARYNLWTGILNISEDYIYSDTDSIKFLNLDKHREYIDRYNEQITAKLEKACRYHNIPVEKIRPKTVKGIEKPLGVWDYEGRYNRFKTLGAKRYMIEEEGHINITVSGVNKKVAVPYLEEKYKTEVFEHFTDNLMIPAEYTGKNTHTYLDTEKGGYVIDYLGNISEWHELSAVHLEPAEYSLSLAAEYVNFLLSLYEV